MPEVKFDHATLIAQTEPARVAIGTSILELEMVPDPGAIVRKALAALREADAALGWVQDQADAQRYPLEGATAGTHELPTTPPPPPPASEPGTC